MDHEEQLRCIKQFLADKYGDEFLDILTYDGFKYDHEKFKWVAV